MKKIITHSGTFHTDEIFAIALLAKFYLDCPVSELDLIRTRDEKELDKFQKDKNAFVIDVGLKFEPEFLNFDHHQDDSRLVWREDQKPEGFSSNSPFKKSSCGLIWDWLLINGNEELKGYNYKLIRKIENMVKKVDLSDGGEIGWNEAKSYSYFNRKKTDSKGNSLSTEEYEKIQYSQFKKALQLAEWYIENFIYLRSKTEINEQKVKEAIEEAEFYDHPEVLFFKNDPFNSKHLGSILSKKAKIIAVYDEDDKNWSLKVVNDSSNSLFKGRLKMPRSWSGMQGEELKKKSGFYYANFCHKDRFIMTLDDCTKDECLEICYTIIRINESRR